MDLSGGQQVPSFVSALPPRRVDCKWPEECFCNKEPAEQLITIESPSPLVDVQQCNNAALWYREPTEQWRATEPQSPENTKFHFLSAVRRARDQEAKCRTWGRALEYPRSNKAHPGPLPSPRPVVDLPSSHIRPVRCLSTIFIDTTPKWVCT